MIEKSGLTMEAGGRVNDCFTDLILASLQKAVLDQNDLNDIEGGFFGRPVAERAGRGGDKGQLVLSHRNPLGLGAEVYPGTIGKKLGDILVDGPSAISGMGRNFEAPIMTSVFKEPYLQDEAAAFEALEAIVWHEGPVCPHCGCMGRIAALNGVKDKKGRARLGLKKCYDFRKQFTVRVGTIFERSHVPLHIWFQAAYLMCSSKKGVSSNQLHRTLGVTLQTAWFMSHRIRESMLTGSLAPMGGADGTVEADETFIGRKEGTIKRRGHGHKNAILSLVDRESC